MQFRRVSFQVLQTLMSARLNIGLTWVIWSQALLLLPFQWLVIKRLKAGEAFASFPDIQVNMCQDGSLDSCPVAASSKCYEHRVKGTLNQFTITMLYLEIIWKKKQMNGNLVRAGHMVCIYSGDERDLPSSVFSFLEHHCFLKVLILFDASH